MNEQLSLCDMDKIDNTKRQNRTKWRKGMQSYCDRQQQNGNADMNGWCACGYMDFCNNCNGADFSRACVDSIEEMCNKKGIIIDYSRTDYEKQLKEYEL